MENEKPVNSDSGNYFGCLLLFVALSLLAFVGALYAIGITEPLVLLIAVIWIIRLGIQRAR